MSGGKIRRRTAAVALGLAFALCGASVALAVDEKDGTRTCVGGRIGAVQARYYHYLGYIAPGTGVVRWDTPYDSAWHLTQHDGAPGGGYWYTVGYYLDFSNTYGLCRNYT